MPLDGTELFANSTLAKLWEVECLLATEDQWCKGRLHDRRRSQHCLVGAITEANGRQELTRPIIRAIKEISSKHYWRIELFNDDPGTNHQDVLQVLRRARLIIISDTARADGPKSWCRKMLEIAGEIFPISSGHSRLYGDSDPVPIPVRINGATRPDEWRPSPERVHETVDMFQ